MRLRWLWRALGLCFLALLFSAHALAQTRNLPLPVKIAAEQSPNTYEQDGGTYTVTGVEIGLFTAGNLAIPVSSLPVRDVPALTETIDGIKMYALDVPNELVPEDGTPYRLGLRYHATYTAKAIVTTPQRTVPGGTLAERDGHVWAVVDGVFMRDGQPTQGRGSQIIYIGGVVYGLGTDGAWWKFQGPVGSGTEWASTYTGTEPTILVTFQPKQTPPSEWSFADETMRLEKGVFVLTKADKRVPMFTDPPPSPLYGRIIGSGL